MPYCVLGQIEIILHLLYIRKEIRIKTLLIYILQFLSCSMLYCTQYKSISPWVSTVLALLSLVTLGYLSWCQEKHIEYLNRSIIELCTQLPPSTDAGDGLHENWVSKLYTKQTESIKVIRRTHCVRLTDILVPYLKENHLTIQTNNSTLAKWE